MKDLKKTIFNFLIFILLIVVTFKYVLRNQSLSKVFEIISNVDIKYVIIGIFCMIGYFMFECVNIKNVLNVLGKKVPLRRIYKYVSIGFLFSGITPAASGGQPMQIYFMHKDDIPVSYSTLALLVELISFQIMVLLFGILGVIVNYELLNGISVIFYIVGTTISLIALTVMLVCFLKPNLARKVVNIFIKLLKLFRFKKIETLKEKADLLLESYSTSLKLLKKDKSIFIKSLILVFCQMALYYSVPYFVCKAFNINTYSILKIITMQGLLFCSVSSIPMPGAVGVSEGLFLSIYNNIFGKELLGSATLLNRFINFYLFIFVGLLVTIFNIIKIKKSKDK